MHLSSFLLIKKIHINTPPTLPKPLNFDLQQTDFSFQHIFSNFANALIND